MSRYFYRPVVILLCAGTVLAGEAPVREFNNGVPDRYLVRLADELTPSQSRVLALQLASEHGGKVEHVFDVLPASEMSLPSAAVQGIARNPRVQYVEQVLTGSVSQVQSNAPWHLDRLDQRYLPLDTKYSSYCNVTDVVVYVIDTGIRASHREFWTNSVNPASRVIAGKSVRTGESDTNATNPCPGRTWGYYGVACPNGDPYCAGGGHGTAVASIVGGAVYGVFSDVKLIAVRTHDCAGYSDTATVSRGLEWIYNDKAARIAPAVANLSFGFDVQQQTSLGKTSDLLYMEEWIAKLVDERNITVVTAANNHDQSASLHSPARLARGNQNGLPQKVITVGGSTTNDGRWMCNAGSAWESCTTANRGSNWGSSVDIFAPAQNVDSAGIKAQVAGYECCDDSDTAERQVQRSGTSFAAAAVSGMAARYLIGIGATLTPSQVWQSLLTDASIPTTDPVVMRDPAPGTDPSAGPLNGSPNRLMYRQGASRCRSY